MDLMDQLLLGRGGPPPDQQPQPNQQQLLAPQQPTAQQPALQPGQHMMQVHGYMSGAGTSYVDDTGRMLAGTPDANGMMDMPVNSDGTYGGQPAFLNLGPPYTGSGGLFTGASMAPPTYDPSPDISGRGGAAGPVAPAPAGALDYSTYQDAFPANWQDFTTPHNTGTGAGFFTMDSFYGGQGLDVPHQFQSGSSLPSTNNWRLLPPQYRSSQYVMRNGRIIDLNGSLGGPAGWQQTGDRYRSGAGEGYPSAIPIGLMSNVSGVGWPGQLSSWANVGFATDG